VQAVQIFPSAASTTCERFIFREKILYPETFKRVTAEREARQMIAREPKGLEAGSRYDFLEPLQEFLRSVKDISDLIRSFDPARFLAPLHFDLSRLTTQFDELHIEKITRSFVDAFLIALLERAAESGDESVFLGIEKAIDWSARLPEDFIRGINLALKAGAFLLARELSAKGAKRYPDHLELQKAARVLAPPKVIRSDLPPTPSVKANREWLKENAKNYRGRWVALRNGEIVGVATSFDELAKQVGDTRGILLTRV